MYVFCSLADRPTDKVSYKLVTPIGNPNTKKGLSKKTTKKTKFFS